MTGIIIMVYSRSISSLAYTSIATCTTFRSRTRVQNWTTVLYSTLAPPSGIYSVTHPRGYYIFITKRLKTGGQTNYQLLKIFIV